MRILSLLVAVATAMVPYVHNGPTTSIDWHGCEPDLAAIGARCGELTVPLNYQDPAGRTISVALAMRPATDQAHKLGTLVVNTGGPGPSRDGVQAIAGGIPGFDPGGQPDLAARYDLVGVDPRFFGLSTPLDCGWPTGEYLDSTQLATPDRASFDASVTVAKDLAARCAAQSDLLPYASTRNIARDLDAVRAALGVPRISYLGWSYGTYLGSVYVQMFPQRVDRIVLDSAWDPRVYGPRQNRDLAGPDDAALRDWAGWAAARDNQYGLGDSVDAVLATVARIQQAAPLRVGQYQVTADMLPGLMLTASDDDAAYAEFSDSVAVLRDAAAGKAVTPTGDQALLLSLFNDNGTEPAYGFSATVANQCADRAAPRDLDVYYRDIQRHLAGEPFYGPLFRHVNPCAFWPATPAEPPTTVANDHPALIISASGDPATPYPGQLALHADLTGSRQLTLAGAFRHGVYLGSARNACVDDTATNYLLTGTLPATDRTCR